MPAKTPIDARDLAEFSETSQPIGEMLEAFSEKMPEVSFGDVGKRADPLPDDEVDDEDDDDEYVAPTDPDVRAMMEQAGFDPDTGEELDDDAEEAD